MGRTSRAHGSSVSAGIKWAELSHLGSDVAGVDFVVIDVETTGCHPVSDRVVEVAAVRVRDGEVIDEFATLVNPDRAIPNTEIHWITTADVEGAPTWAQVAPTLLSYLSGAVMVCHKAVFDHPFLLREFDRVKIDIGAIPTLCTLRTAESLWGKGHNDLNSLVKRLTGHQPNPDLAHTALGDARTTERLLRWFLHDAPEPLRRLWAPPTLVWPARPTPGGVSTRNRVIAGGPDSVQLVEQLPITCTHPVAAVALASYELALQRAMDDRKIDLEETPELDELIRCNELTRTTVERVCRKLLERHWLDVHDDGNVTWQEANALSKMALLVGLPKQVAAEELGHQDKVPFYRREPILRWTEIPALPACGCGGSVCK
jgi:DNA polymerase III epsilon subunit family exonuclease